MKVVLSLLLGVLLYAGAAFGATPDFADFEKEVTRLYQKEVASQLVQHPQNAWTASELARLCRLITQVDRLKGLHVENSDQDGLLCRNRLRADFPDEPATQLYFLEELDAPLRRLKALSLLDEAKGWSLADQYQLNVLLANTYLTDPSLHYAATVYAMSAYALIPGVQATSILVDASVRDGNLERAQHLAKGMMTRPIQEYEKADAITSLTKAQLFEEALQVGRTAQSATLLKVDAITRSRLTQFAEGDEAYRDRLTLELVLAAPEKRTELARLWFEYELSHGDAEGVKNAYAALAGRTPENDQFLIQWSRLAISFPGAALSAIADMPGLFIYNLGWLLLLFCYPLCILAPAHYLGLWRMRKLSSYGEPTRVDWGLGRTWLALGLFNVAANVLTEYCYPGSFNDPSTAQYPTGNGPNLYLIIVPLMFAIVMLTAGKRLMGAIFSSSSNPVIGVAMSIILGGAFIFAGPSLHLSETALSSMANPGLYIKEAYESYGMLLCLFLFGVLGPIYEEVLCRGLLLNSVQRHVGFWGANAVQAVIFMLLHTSPENYPYYLASGFAAGWLYRYTGGLYAPILMHMTINTTAVISVVSAVLGQQSVT